MLDIGQMLPLMLVAFLAALLSGTIGFGGGIILLPVLSHTVGVKDAVPILTAVQIVSNASRATFSFHEIEWRLVRRFVMASVPCSLVGGLMFVHLNKEYVLKLMGVILLCYVAAMITTSRGKRKEQEKLPDGGRWFLPTACLVGLLSGLIGTAGPIGAAAFLSCNLSPAGYIASDAISSLIMHGSKLTLYSNLMNLPMHDWVIAASLSVATMVGSFCGKALTEKLSEKAFRSVALGALTVAGITLLV